MIVRYWQPFQEIETIRQQLDNIFEDLTPATTDWIPAVDLIDAGDNYVLDVVLPGLKGDDINIEASRKSIAVSGERTAAGDDQQVDRKSVVQGKSVDLGGRRIIKKKNKHKK